MMLSLVPYPQQGDGIARYPELIVNVRYPGEPEEPGEYVRLTKLEAIRLVSVLLAYAQEIDAYERRIVR